MQEEGELSEPSSLLNLPKGEPREEELENEYCEVEEEKSKDNDDSLRKLTEEMIFKLIDSNANSRAGSIQLPSLGYQAEEDKYTYKEPLEKVMNQLKEEYLFKGVPTE